MPTPFADPSRLACPRDSAIYSETAMRTRRAGACGTQRSHKEAASADPAHRAALPRSAGSRGARIRQGACGSHASAVRRGVAGEPFLLRDPAAVEGWLRAEDRFGSFAERTRKATLFLDGVDGLSLPAQDWLLRTAGLGDSAPYSRRNLPVIEMRVIASTTDDLRTLAAAGRFRQELYQRLATVEIAVPPLRERMEDLSELAEYFLDRFGRLQGNHVPGIAPKAMQRLQEHPWPGNVRELKGAIRDAVFRSDGVLLREEDLTLLVQPPEEDCLATNAGASIRLQDVVERHVFGVLKGCGGNKLRAAEMLGISRSTLYRMLETGNSAGCFCDKRRSVNAQGVSR